VKKLLTWAAVILIALWVINNPTQAAADLQKIGHAASILASKL
jgi:hypothetical protein